MRRRIAFVSVIVLIALSFQEAAAAKGVSEAKMTWDGLATPIAIGPGASTGGATSLIRDTGVMPAMWLETPNPMLDAAPTDDLGPAITITWTVPGPMQVPDTIVQTIYLYAADGPLVFTPPGQPFFGHERTVGGWFRAPARLTATLQDLGAPSRAALESPSDETAADPWLPIGATLAGIAVVVALARIAARRRVALAATVAT